MTRAPLLILACAAFLGAAHLQPAAAQSSAEIRSLSDQVERLQRELNVLQRNVYQGQGARPATGGAAPAPGEAGRVADLQIRLDDMDSRISQLVGQIEETNHRIATMEQKFERFSSDLDVRLNELSAAGGAPQAAAAAQGMSRPQPIPPAGAGDPSQNATTSGNLGTLSAGSAPVRAGAQANAGPSPALQGAALPDGTPDEQYKYAFGLLSRADYAGAERALSAFVDKHPTHSLAGNAQYWLGESFYARNDFNAAARAFAIGYQKYPKSAKAPDNLLKLGLSLGNLNKPKEACQSYALLRKDFPKAPAEILRRADGEQKRLRCA
ncbi:MAG: tol-pal system protein YbgF [Alphaproteobacteria bacterium]